ncbi:MAG: hypothetical protein ACE5HE_13680, partial [Phycisphaerae bacterium]
MMRITSAVLLLLFWSGLGAQMAAAYLPLGGGSISGVARGAIPGDCDNNGIVDLDDFADLAFFIDGPDCGDSDSSCRCFDLNGDHCVDLADFAALQVAFGSAQ